MDNKKMNSTGVEDHILDVEHLSMYFTTKNRGKKSTVKAVDDVSFYVKLKSQGFPAFMTFKDGLYYVRAGAFRNMENAVRQEQELRKLGYPTLLVKT